MLEINVLGYVGGFYSSSDGCAALQSPRIVFWKAALATIWLNVRYLLEKCTERWRKSTSSFSPTAVTLPHLVTASVYVSERMRCHLPTQWSLMLCAYYLFLLGKMSTLLLNSMFFFPLFWNSWDALSIIYMTYAEEVASTLWNGVHFRKKSCCIFMFYAWNICCPWARYAW